MSDSSSTLWIIIAPLSTLSMGVFRQEYWNGVPFPLLGNLPNPEIESKSPPLQTDSLPTEPSLKKPGDETKAAAEGRS